MSLVLILMLAGCTGDITALRVDESARHSGEALLVLGSARLPPLPESVRKNVMEHLERSIALSPYVGRVTNAKDLKAPNRLEPAIRRNLDLFSNTLSLVGVSNPEIANQLGQDLNVAMLISLQLTFQPCQTCDFGDQVWLSGYLIEASTGQIILRGNYRGYVDSAEPAELEETALELTAEFLDDFETALIPKWHRMRFKNLKRGA